MAAIRMTANILLNGVSQSAFRPFATKRIALTFLRSSPCTAFRDISTGSFRCAAVSLSGDGRKKASARLSQVQQLLLEAEERASCADNEPPPKISLKHVSVSFATSGGPGGQNFNQDPKVGMRFNVKRAIWLSERLREKIMQLEKKRINKDGEIVLSSTKTRTQQENIQDALSKLQAIIDAAAYVPPALTEAQKKKIAELSAKSEQMRLLNKKVLSQNKSLR